MTPNQKYRSGIRKAEAILRNGGTVYDLIDQLRDMKRGPYEEGFRSVLVLESSRNLAKTFEVTP